MKFGVKPPNTEKEYPPDRSYRHPQVLDHLLNERRLSMAEAAEILGCSDPTVTRWANRYNINND